MAMRDEAIRSMSDYFDSKRFVEHTLKVLGAAEKIAESEGLADGFTKSSLVLGSIFHDIGIPEAQKKYGSIDAPWQEKEGPAVARHLMTALGVRPDILERVCFIVGAHHTKDKVDGMDFQVIWEADFVVNIEEKNLVFTKDDIAKAIEANTSTAMGRTLAREAAGRIGLL
jgi:hypothetical protein